MVIPPLQRQINTWGHIQNRVGGDDQVDFELNPFLAVFPFEKSKKYDSFSELPFASMQQFPRN